MTVVSAEGVAAYIRFADESARASAKLSHNPWVRDSFAPLFLRQVVRPQLASAAVGEPDYRQVPQLGPFV